PPVCEPACPPPPCLPSPRPCPPPSPMAQLAVRYHHVTVTIQDQVAITRVDQVFYNPNNWEVEGTYLFPLPAEAAVSAFTLWVDGKPVEGKVLSADQARQQYQQIVSSLRDPALLEYAGRGAVQASIFPIPPQGERRVELEYTQVLAAQNGLVRYVYPLNTEKFSSAPLDSVSIQVDVKASAPIRAVYSPSHTVAVSREDDFHVKVGYEASNVQPDADFALYYSLGEEEAFHLLSFRDPGDSADPDGFFLLLLAPRPDAAALQTQPKDVILVLDRSGSMEGDKFNQAQDALRYVLGHLNPDDRFNAIAFSTGLDTYASELRPASEASQALQWVDRLSVQGSTDINRALLEAASMAGRERPTYLIFLTDGLPTEGVVDSKKILANLATAAPTNLRLFPFGVGYDVDTFLLDSLAQAHHGATTYVLPNERLDESLSTFYAKISAPVLTDLTLDFGSLAVYDQYPSPLPDLFAGSQIVLVGRYRQGGSATVRLTGTVNGQSQTFEFPEQVFDQQSSGSDFQSPIPRLWATRKIGYLLNQVRLDGASQETIDQIVRLSIRYGIVTPYTSYLVTETPPLGAAEQARIAKDQFNQMQAAPAATASGQAAVQAAAGQGALAGAMAPAAPEAGAANQVRVVGTRTFVLSDGKWVDTGFDPKTMQTTKVAFLSQDYFALAESSPELAAAFALGKAVIAFSGGTAYEVVEADATVPTVSLPPTGVPTLLPASTPAPGVTPTPRTGNLLPGSPTPAIPTPDSRPAQSSPLPCLGGLLPLALLPLGLMWIRSRRR
ncbi:MAG TPA: VIT domain-containing protein, partial [Anaerolineales bacterium]